MDGARKFIDFMVSPDFQADIPLNMFVFPANDAGGACPRYSPRYAATPTNVISFDPATIDANRERWIQEWTDIVLR